MLLQQFHDILPGTSIAWVHQEAERNYADVAARLETLIERSARALLDTGAHTIALNEGPFPIDGVPAMGGSAPETGNSTVARVDDGWLLSGGTLELTVDDAGQFTSLLDLRTGRETFPAGRPGNLFQLFRDTPTQWDAWDIDFQLATLRFHGVRPRT